MDYQSILGEIEKAKQLIAEERADYFRRWCISTLARIHAVVEHSVSSIEAVGNDSNLSTEERLELITKLSDESKKLLAWATAQTNSQMAPFKSEQQLQEEPAEDSKGGQSQSKLPFFFPPSGSKVN